MKKYIYFTIVLAILGVLLIFFNPPHANGPSTPEKPQPSTYIPKTETPHNPKPTTDDTSTVTTPQPNDINMEYPIPDEMPPNTKPTDTACTMDAKICPDGSAVGRIGPNCEFAPCPTE